MKRRTLWRRGLAARLGLGAALVGAAVLGLGSLSEAEARGDAASASAREAFALQAKDGAKIYATMCSSCHMASGEGVPAMFPPVAGSEWVTGDERRLIRVILGGLAGEIEVAGEVYAGHMPPWAGALKDAELAALATYLRSSWGNQAPPVTAETVARERAATAGRTKPWTAAELDAELKK